MPRQVCSGAMLRCSLGSNLSFLTVQPHNRVIATNPAANIHDNKPGVNFPPFGVCVNIGGPCVPVTPLPWKLGGKPVKIGSGGILTLTEADTLICQVGGVIKVIDPGQNCVYINTYANVYIKQNAKSVETTKTQETTKQCPKSLPDQVPEGWRSYGDGSVFHCGYTGIVETEIPTPDHLQLECFYDESGQLVDENHEFAGCRGTPNQYDAHESPISHTFLDSGGIIRSGLPAFLESRRHDLVSLWRKLKNWTLD
ncbi:DUF4280 domain-containing protein [Coleofasciculus sp. F4-SAH-05]|uniref:DUF4280 domain-containing protein n=1 Tax=Coleofasciculus sp. F4-SAH-05 TaxID=3069525 RepID=UPI0032F7E943